MRQIAVVLALLLVPQLAVRAQTCTDAHYRWTVKTTLDMRDATPAKTTPASMLKWKALPLYRGAVGSHDCTPRAGHEATVYAVTGWARSWHIEKGPKGDLDWHVELTSGRHTDSLNCIVVEIPDPKYGAVFDTARAQFLDALGQSKPNKRKWLVPPVRITVIGPAFFDGEHRGAKGSGKPPSGHGHCNALDSALWEIHPVYHVQRP
jgi:hypothetical protein